MALLTVQDVPAAGKAGVTFAAATLAGDTAPTGPGHALIVRNTDANVKTVTLTTPGTVDGLAIADAAVTVPVTTGVSIIPLVGRLYGTTAAIAYSGTGGVTGVTVAVVKIAR